MQISVSPSRSDGLHVYVARDQFNTQMTIFTGSVWVCFEDSSSGACWKSVSPSMLPLLLPIRGTRGRQGRREHGGINLEQTGREMDIGLF
jgi:hypothetical protein